MKVELKENCCVVTREEGDPKFYGIINAAGESKLLHHIKLELLKQGHKVIKKRMHKDGHLVDDMQQYIRTKKGYKPSFHIWNSNWAISGAEEDFNNGEVILSLERDIWNEEYLAVEKAPHSKLPLFAGTLTDKDAIRLLEKRLLEGE